MLFLIVALDVFILIGVILLVIKALKPQQHSTMSIPTNPNGFFKKKKHKPIALDDQRAYELEQESRKGPRP